MSVRHRIDVHRLMCAGAVVCLTAALAGCTSHSATPSTTKSKPVLGAHVRVETLTQVKTSIAALYRAQSDITQFTVDQVQYTPTTRDKVLGVCAGGAAAADASALQSTKVSACAPLIYFFYSYASKHSVSSSYGVAEDLYNYAVTNITGPFNTQTTLNGLLRTWGVPVSTPPTPPPSNLTGTKALAARLVATASKAMSASTGVRVQVTATDAATKITNRATLDSGRTQASENLTAGAANGTLRITAAAAYLSGNRAGLIEFFGLSAKAAARTGNRWVSIKAGTSQYTSFASGNLVAALPSTILPDTDTDAVARATTQGTPVYRLRWAGPTTGATSIQRTLDLAVADKHLPVRATSVAGKSKQTVTFSRWGQNVTVPAPAYAIPFTSVTAK